MKLRTTDDWIDHGKSHGTGSRARGCRPGRNTGPAPLRTAGADHHPRPALHPAIPGGPDGASQTDPAPHAEQLEGANLLTRQSDGRHYGTGSRMRRMAEDVLLNDTRHGTRHAILRALVDEIGESCN